MVKFRWARDIHSMYNDRKLSSSTPGDFEPEKLLLNRKISMPYRDPQQAAPRSPKLSRTSGRQPVPVAEPFTFVRSSIASEEHQEHNEDYVIADRSRGLAAVFDGVGGITGGEIASEIAARSIHARWKRLIQCQTKNQPGPLPTGQDGQHIRLLVDDGSIDVAALIRGLIEDAHAQIQSEGVQRVKNQYSGLPEPLTPKTTVALVALHRTNRSIGYSMVCAWVGDSRVYLLPDQQALIRLTSDDGLLTELVKAGLLAENIAKRIDQATRPWNLSSVERLFFEKRNGITQALGDELAPVAHVTVATVAPGDRLLLCTDGIHDNLTDDELETLLRQSARTTVAKHIVTAAAARSRQDVVENMRAKPDDMSAIVITCHH